MNVLSLFDGIATGMLALKNAGITVNKYYASEIDKKAIDIAKKNFPEIIEIGDVNNVRVAELGKIDLIIAGSPCQGFSRNGKHLNFDDERSGLFFKFVEILEEVKKSNPEVKFMLENVRMKTEWQDIISEFLEVQPITIDSRIHTAQARERTYWTNIEGVSQPERIESTIRQLAEPRNKENYILQNGIQNRIAGILQGSTAEKGRHGRRRRQRRRRRRKHGRQHRRHGRRRRRQQERSERIWKEKFACDITGAGSNKKSCYERKIKNEKQRRFSINP